jgi:general secretion pathway protein E
VTLSQKLRVPFELEDGISYGIADAGRGEDPPAVREVDEIFESAVLARATDVHVEPYEDGGRVRQRVDGVLRESRRVAAPLFDRVLSRIKLLAGMDIADRRLPQDGRYSTKCRGRLVEARVSSLPTLAGERLAVRLLEPQSRVPSFEELGMPATIAASFRRFVRSAAGFVVVCGPTGSGKTTTLYASLAERRVESEHACSVEDPVEIRIAGVAQLQVNARAGLTFAGALRAFLRQDPDVIMIGEMRDAETAAVAASAALCGQLVLTSLHSTDALTAVDRLVDLGIGERRLTAAVSVILSQRLVRQLCTYCKETAAASTAAERFEIPCGSLVYTAAGCAHCGHTGYRGRSGIFEIAAMRGRLREAVESGTTPRARREAARRDGYEPMSRHAARLIRSGETSVEEALRLLDGLQDDVFS